MLFPIGDENIKGGHKPIFSYSLILVNVLIFAYEMQLGDRIGDFVNTFGATPREVVAGNNLFTLFTSIFLHGSFMHLLGNMLFLWIFADNIEAVVGNIRFMLFYLLGGLVAHAAHIAYDPTSIVPTVGASGSIAAVMGAYLVMFPKSKVRVLFIIFPFKIPAFLFLGLWIYLQIQSGIGSLEMRGEQVGGVAYWAHIGGFVFGVLYGFIKRSAPMKQQYQNMEREYV
ncbi:MAG: rhomboid family intramembrane serine protease [Saprospiraceae bacterium]|nr:rhomboid family intramembrane serine protease [Saprospiraceae bacterium]